MRILEIRHVAVRARIERVNNHLSVDGPCDFDAPVLQVLGHWQHTPFGRVAAFPAGIAEAHRGQ
jgi:hypothetical protein